MSNTEIINKLSETRYNNPNSFYDTARIIARETNQRLDEVISIYNDSLEDEDED